MLAFGQALGLALALDGLVGDLREALDLRGVERALDQQVAVLLEERALFGGQVRVCRALGHGESSFREHTLCGL